MHKIDWLVLEGRIDEALAALRGSSLDVLDAQSVYLNREGYEALLLALAGNLLAAQTQAARALTRLEPELARLPNDPRLLLHAGQLKALIGQVAEGERLIRRTLTAGDPAQVDRFDRSFFLKSLAIMFATSGQHDHARDTLRIAQSEPGQITPHLVRLHPALSRYAQDEFSFPRDRN